MERRKLLIGGAVTAALTAVPQLMGASKGIDHKSLADLADADCPQYGFYPVIVDTDMWYVDRCGDSWRMAMKYPDKNLIRDNMLMMYRVVDALVEHHKKNTGEWMNYSFHMSRYSAKNMLQWDYGTVPPIKDANKQGVLSGVGPAAPNDTVFYDWNERIGVPFFAYCKHTHMFEVRIYPKSHTEVAKAVDYFPQLPDTYSKI